MVFVSGLAFLFDRRIFFVYRRSFFIFEIISTYDRGRLVIGIGWGYTGA